ncbi:MAG: M23 family metallopeptidase [Ignavibacteria bacterium]
MSRLIDRSFHTILLISPDSSQTKTFQIRSKHILQVRRYIIGSVIFVLVLFGIITTLILQIFSNRNQIVHLNTVITKMESDARLVDSLRIKEAIREIEYNIKEIDSYVRARLTNQISAGGESDTNKPPDASIYNFYRNYTKYLYQKIQTLPLGYPKSGELKSEFGYRANPFSRRGSEFHKGIDIKGEIGEPIYATADGTVESADWDKGYGKCVKIHHKSGYTSIFGHLSAFNVEPGQHIKAGDIIGYVGNTGRSTGPHLHYEIRKNDEPINTNWFVSLNN